MALSNVFREPQRELTESVVGVILLAVVAGGDYAFATWFEHWNGYRQYTDGPHAIFPWPLGMCLGFLLMVLLLIGLVATHEFGEFVCNALERSGLHLRPRRTKSAR